LILVAPLAIAQTSTDSTASVSYTDAIRAGDTYFQRGQSVRALSEWSRAYDLATKDGDQGRAIGALARRAEAYAALGYYKNAAADLRSAIALSEAAEDAATKARLQGRLGNVLFQAGDPEQSEVQLRACLNYARGAGEVPLQARTLNDLGNLLASRGEAGAGDAYLQSVSLAREAGDQVLAATALLNRARSLLENGDTAAGEKQLDEAMAAFRALDDTSLKAAGLLGAGRLLTQVAQQSADAQPRLDLRINDIYREAEAISRAIGDGRALSYALGYRGELYEKRGRWDDAVPLARQALFEAQQVGASEIAYLWEWQLARIHKAMGDAELALADYRQATFTLQHLRKELLTGSSAGNYALQKDAGTVFLEYADLLLTESADQPSEEDTQAMLAVDGDLRRRALRARGGHLSHPSAGPRGASRQSAREDGAGRITDSSGRRDGEHYAISAAARQTDTAIPAAGPGALRGVHRPYRE
jgi:tetratricopeptide (TPR) repeat protein